MTRVIEWAEWRVRRAGLAGKTARLSERRAPGHGNPTTRTRDPEDVAVITRMVTVEVARRRADGRLIKLGEREYELRVRTTVPPPS